jgi:DNA-binding MarR family transcriptional regulator
MGTNIHWLNIKKTLYTWAMDTQSERELQILEYLEHKPDTTQADLATQLGVAVGSVNWHLKRLINKGYVKARQMQRRRLRYLVTPQGLAEKARLTQAYVRASFRLYRETRDLARSLLAQVAEAGYDAVCVEGDSELADICRLTCLEQKLSVAQDEEKDHLPVVVAEGMRLSLCWPQQSGSSDKKRWC